MTSLARQRPNDSASFAAPLAQPPLSGAASLPLEQPVVQRPTGSASNSATLPKCAGRLAHRTQLPFAEYADSAHSLNHSDPRLSDASLPWNARHPKASTGSGPADLLHDVHGSIPISPLASPINFAQGYESFLPPVGSSQHYSRFFPQQLQSQSAQFQMPPLGPAAMSNSSSHPGPGPSSAPASASVTPDVSRRASITNTSANIYYPENYPDMPSSHALDAELAAHREKRASGGDSIAARLIGLITPRSTRRQFHAASHNSISASRSVQQLPLEIRPSAVHEPFAVAAIGVGAGAGAGAGEATAAMPAESDQSLAGDTKRLLAQAQAAQMMARLSHPNPSAPPLLARHPALSKFYDASTLPHR